MDPYSSPDMIHYNSFHVHSHSFSALNTMVFYMFSIPSFTLIPMVVYMFSIPSFTANEG